MRKTLSAVGLTLLLMGGLAFAQTIVKANQGQPGTQGPWPVTVQGGSMTNDAGVIVIAEAPHRACTNTTMNVGTTGTACPASARSDRATLMIELVQTGETLTITTDGATTASATDGIAISSGGTYTDNLAGTVAASCRCTAATCSVRIVECPN